MFLNVSLRVSVCVSIRGVKEVLSRIQSCIKDWQMTVFFPLGSHQLAQFIQIDAKSFTHLILWIYVCLNEGNIIHPFEKSCPLRSNRLNESPLIWPEDFFVGRKKKSPICRSHCLVLSSLKKESSWFSYGMASPGGLPGATTTTSKIEWWKMICNPLEMPLRFLANFSFFFTWFFPHFFPRFFIANWCIHSLPWMASIVNQCTIMLLLDSLSLLLGLSLFSQIIFHDDEDDCNS